MWKVHPEASKHLGHVPATIIHVPIDPESGYARQPLLEACRKTPTAQPIVPRPDSRSGTEMLGHGAGQEHTEAVIYYVAPLVLGASFVGLCLVLRGEQRARRRK